MTTKTADPIINLDRALAVYAEASRQESEAKRRKDAAKKALMKYLGDDTEATGTHHKVTVNHVQVRNVNAEKAFALLGADILPAAKISYEKLASIFQEDSLDGCVELSLQTRISVKAIDAVVESLGLEE